MRLCGGNGVSLPVKYLVSVIVIGIAADPASHSLPLLVTALCIQDGLAAFIQQRLIKGHLRSLYLPLSPHVKLGKGGSGKGILQKELLHLLGILQHKAHKFRPDIPLLQGSFPLLQDVGPHGQPGQHMGRPFRLRTAVRVCAGICHPALLLDRHVSVLIIDGKAVLIIHSSLILVDGL